MVDYIPCDYCDAPAVSFVTFGPRGSRRFFCGHEDHRKFGSSDVRPLSVGRHRHYDKDFDQLETVFQARARRTQKGRK